MKPGPELFEQILEQIADTDPEDLVEVAQVINQSVPVFIPHPGPQTEAYYSEADVLLYGGEPGGGKTGLLGGLALNCHERSLIVRVQFSDLDGIIDNFINLIGTDAGFARGQRPRYRKPDGGVINFRGIRVQKGRALDTGKQGNPHDFIGIDEGAQLTRGQFQMLFGWNRTKTPGQRCRIVIASNPPLDAVGDWMVEDFAPWLDPDFDDPAQRGELRWCYYDERGKVVWVEGAGAFPVGDRMVLAHSRTFIPATLADNPSINASEYMKRLSALPEPYRTILMTGNFLHARKDQDYQVIPSAWVRAAQDRWDERPPVGVAMTAIAHDAAGGGSDEAVTCFRYGGWFGEAVVSHGEETADGSSMAAVVLKARRDNCPVVVDMGGGYGGAVAQRLKDNGVTIEKYNGAAASTQSALYSNLGFFNERAASYWRFREALDPDQEGGSVIALPPDPKLFADLTTLTYRITARGIQVEPKEEIRDRLGRSPDRGDAFVMCLSKGGQAVARMHEGDNMPRAVMGHQSARRRSR